MYEKYLKFLNKKISYSQNAQTTSNLLWNIPLYCMKVCHWDWFNKKLNTQQGSRKYRWDFWTKRTLGKKGGVTSQTWNNQDGHNGDEEMNVWETVD